MTDRNDFEAAYMAAARAAGEARERHPSLTSRPQRRPGAPVPAEVGPGWMIYDCSTEAGELDAAGVCVEVVDDEVVTPDGEILARRRFYCLRYWTPGNPWCWVPAGDVDTSQLRFDPLASSQAARWLVRDLNRPGRRKTLTDTDIDALVIAGRLAAAVGAAR